MILTSGIAATACHDAERSRRRRFLEGAIIAQLVTRDGATGLVNRLAFDQYLPRVWRHALREKRSMAILIIDIDHFKKYNDDLGREAGDAAICRVAQVIAGFARRPLDMAARHGGAQFAMILFDLEHPHAQHIAERIREEVQNLRIGREITVSVGVGVTTPGIGQAPESVAQLAAEALYEAKQTGRNRAVVKGAEAYVLLDTGRFGARSSSRSM
jgi:diguanylate cyclase (GGDEF)-like protein